MSHMDMVAQALRELLIARADHKALANLTGEQYDAAVDAWMVRDSQAAMKARAALASLEAAKQEPLTGWQPIETAPNERALLFSPPEALWEDTTGKAGEMRVARPAEWTWARFWMPLPAAPSPGSGT